jgi:glutamate/tyrosine decarboxylase-like PLP-dependent enzyme
MYGLTDGMFDKESLRVLRQALEHLEAGFNHLPAPGAALHYAPDFQSVLFEAADRMRDNYPYFHPLYAGQMLKPPHAVARLAYMLALWLNPNNHALDGGRASSAMEKESVAALARMVGWEKHLGHLCSGGTMANLEALWLAGQLAPRKKILASEQAHYTHRRLSQVLKLDFEAVACDRKGKLAVPALIKALDQGDVGTVVATLGTTATGSVDPLPEILDLRHSYGFRLHVDAAYGGYFCLASNLSSETRRSFDRLSEADSIVIDPHKHGLQPYGCGCVLFRDPSVGRFYRHDSPYTYFTSQELHLGEISLECSRPGAAAVALWATQKLLPLVKGGEFGAMLDGCRGAAVALHEKLRSDDRWLTCFVPELDIVVWGPRAARVSQASALARRLFTKAADQNLHLALASLPVSFFDLQAAGIERDSDTMMCLRSVLMKSEHFDWVEQMWQILDRVISER